MTENFQTTRWSMVLTAAHGEGSAALHAMEQLCRDAWRPLYAFARRWGCDGMDAEDAVQGYITSLLERESLSHVRPGKGRFRSFLLAGLRNHLSDVAAHKNRVKRGGGSPHISLDAEDAEQGYLTIAAQMESPERAFDRMWAIEVMQKAKVKLADECRASGKMDLFEAFFADVSAAPEPYAVLGQRLDMTETALRSISLRLRRRWRELIRAELAQGVSSQEALDEEMAALQAALLG